MFRVFHVLSLTLPPRRSRVSVTSGEPHAEPPPVRPTHVGAPGVTETLGYSPQCRSEERARQDMGIRKSFV